MSPNVPLVLALLVAAPAFAGEPPPDPPSPGEALRAMNAELQEARARRDYEAFGKIRKDRTAEFLARWDKTGATAAGDDRLALAQFFAMAERHGDAMEAYRGAVGDETIDEAERKRARVSCANALVDAMNAKQIPEEEIEAAIEECAKSVEALAGDADLRGSLLLALGRCHDHRGRDEAAVESWLHAAHASPRVAYRAGREVMGVLMKEALDLSRIDAVRQRGHEIAKKLAELQKQYAEQVRAGGNERAIRSAEAMIGRLEKLDAPLRMIGKPAPDWTLEHAYGDGDSIEDYRGKVVLMDFWATWCPWCIKSFPAIRDLLRDYAGKDFAVVGVTASAGVVYDQRWDLDDDFEEKAATKPAQVRMPRGGSEEEVAAYRAKERDIVAKFIENHAMTWDVVMIDRTEPGPKYALTGWPHAVVLDRQGRVRYFKRGALLRDREEQVKKFRKVLDLLLAEEP